MPMFEQSEDEFIGMKNLCDHCSKLHEAHEKKRVSRPNNRFGYEYYCPGTKPDGGEGE